jgi:hypothetical protein
MGCERDNKLKIAEAVNQEEEGLESDDKVEDSKRTCSNR